METRINERFVKDIANSEKTPVYLEYNKLYKEKIRAKFTGLFNYDFNDYSFFNDYFADFSAKSVEISKLFSNLKHKSYTLAKEVAKVGKQIQSISAEYKKVLNSLNFLHTKYEFKLDDVVEDVNTKFLNGLDSWGVELDNQKHYINENMASYFHYKKHEFLQIGDLVNLKTRINSGIDKQFLAFESKQ